MMQGTDRTVVAWDEGLVVGFARALCDGVSNSYISTVAVAEDKRGFSGETGLSPVENGDGKDAADMTITFSPVTERASTEERIREERHW